ncbi:MULTISPECIES: hypothetical protein [unclassified Sphingobium]|uniref:hypothetical protein n=1 Tax=unclassified Sphingobium TaxID=2611147 RepID=UPI0035A61CD6
MRGAVSLQSARAPYRRGGVAFTGTTAVILAIAALDGAGLLRLLDDPVITVLFGQDDGSFAAHPELGELSIEELQAFIDMAPLVDVSAVGEIAEVDIDATLRGLVLAQPQLVDRLDRLFATQDAWEDAQRQIADQGFPSLDALTSAWAEDRKVLTQLQADGIEQGKALADAQARIAELEKAAEPAAKTKAKAKPADSAGD